MNLNASLIITTYNWPEALGAVLDTVQNQKTLPFEVVIADDGSKPPTRDLITQYQNNFPCPIIHVWHEDQGYQAASIRNKAVKAATGDYLVFIDHDCLLRKDFIEEHIRLAKPKHFIAGNRVLISQDYTEEIIRRSLYISDNKVFSFSKQQINRCWALSNLPLGFFRHLNPTSWHNVKACNMSMYAADFMAVGGFEEEFEGWGYEDSDLIVRLLNNNIRRISGRFAITVLHLWHKTNKDQLEQENWQRLQETIKSRRVQSIKGLNQHPA